MSEVSLYTYPGARPAFARAIGPRTAKLAIVGEALGESEDTMGAPFMGASGQELNRMLKEAGINRSDCFLTNVLAFRPQNNDIEKLCVKKAETGELYPMPPFRQGKYIHPQFLSEIDRLKLELSTVRPNLILALGNTACWALLLRSAISSLRGAIAPSVQPSGFKVLPTYHPAAVLRNWALRTIVVTDLIKAFRERDFPEIKRPERTIVINPSLSDIANWIAGLSPHASLACDIETSRGQITMVGFASSASSAIVIPFVDPQKPTYSYWDSKFQESQAWNFVGQLLEGSRPKIFQNGLYDLQYLLRLGFRPRNCTEDTMLLHHSLFPELQKGLGFLGSIYTNEASWKLMRGQDDSNKKDE